MKVYLCGPCDSEHRSLMVRAKIAVQEVGLEVYCPFELKIPNAWDYTQEDWAQQVFDRDIEELENCDAVIAISEGRVGTAGSNFEIGYAYALHKPVYTIQITDDPTSLMTYCGSTYFINSNKSNLFSEMNWIAARIEKGDVSKWVKECETVLT